MGKIIPTIFQAILYWISLALLKFFTRFEVSGRENLKGVENGPLIFASNHQSYIDGGICGAALPRSSLWPKKFFPVRFLGAERFFRWYYFPINIIYKMGGVVKLTPAKEKKPDNSHLLEVLAESIKRLREGEKIWIFPEGGFNDDGSPKKPRNGVAYLHQQTGAPIVPVAITGNENILSGSVFSFTAIKSIIKNSLRMNKIKVTIGKPIYNLNAPTLEDGTEKIMNEIYKLKSL